MNSFQYSQQILTALPEELMLYLIINQLERTMILVIQSEINVERDFYQLELDKR